MAGRKRRGFVSIRGRNKYRKTTNGFRARARYPILNAAAQPEQSDESDLSVETEQPRTPEQEHTSEEGSETASESSQDSSRRQGQLPRAPIPTENTREQRQLVETQSRNQILKLLKESSHGNNYDSVQFISSGAFGRVWGAMNKNRRHPVALKALLNEERNKSRNDFEISLLRRLNEEGGGECNILKCFGSFEIGNMFFIETELLDINLAHYIKHPHYVTPPLSALRVMCYQILTAMLKLREIGAFHTDLKTENIMLVNRRSGSDQWRIKVIDFGNCLFFNRNARSCLIQTLYYRAPEVFLGLRTGPPADMWSLGCIMAEFFTVDALFRGTDDYYTLRNIIALKGMPPSSLIGNGNKWHFYFNETMPAANLRDAVGNERQFSYKTITQHEQEFPGTKGHHGIPQNTQRVKSIEGIVKVNSATVNNRIYREWDNEVHQSRASDFCSLLDEAALIEFLEKTLNYDPEKRITIEDALNSTFFNMNHIRYPDSRYYIKASKLMDPVIARSPRIVRDIVANGPARVVHGPNVPEGSVCKAVRSFTCVSGDAQTISAHPYCSEYYTIIQKTAVNWWLVQKPGGRKGWAPASCFQELNEVTSKVTYVPNNPDMLPLKQGEVLDFVRGDPNGNWWIYRNSNGFEGYVDLNMIQGNTSNDELVPLMDPIPNVRDRSTSNTAVPNFLPPHLLNAYCFPSNIPKCTYGRPYFPARAQHLLPPLSQVPPDPEIHPSDPTSSMS